MFPLPVPHAERTSTDQFFPQIDDPTGDGERIWSILGMMKITQGRGAGKRLRDIAPAWQERWVRTLFGAVKADGTKAFNESFLLISKKNGKTTLAGMLAVAYSMAFPIERGSTLILAATKEQAHLAYDSMASTIEADPFLSRRFKVRRYRADIIHLETGTVLQAIAAHFAATVGSIPSFFLVDELHLLGQTPKGANLVKQLSSGAAARERSMGLYISTAPLAGQLASGIYSATLGRSRRILAGEAPEDKLLPVLFELPPDTDPDDHKNWWMCNPSSGYTVTDQWLRNEFQIAKNDPEPHALAHFRSQHLNIHSAETIGVDRWNIGRVWDELVDKSITFESLIRDATQFFVGVDAGGMNDATALLIIGQMPDGAYQVWAHQWFCQQGYLEHCEHNEYDQWITEGELSVVDEPGDDLKEVFDMIWRLYATARLAAVGVDPYGLHELAKQLEARGANVFGIRQGWQLTPHIDAIERICFSGMLRQFGGSMLRWNIHNARLEERSGAKTLGKPQGAAMGKDKIDGAVCLVLAGAVITESPPPSMYNDQGRSLIM